MGIGPPGAMAPVGMVVMAMPPTWTPRIPFENRGPATMIRPYSYNASRLHLPVGCGWVALG